MNTLNSEICKNWEDQSIFPKEKSRMDHNVKKPTIFIGSHHIRSLTQIQAASNNVEIGSQTEKKQTSKHWSSEVIEEYSRKHFDGWSRDAQLACNIFSHQPLI